MPKIEFIIRNKQIWNKAEYRFLDCGKYPDEADIVQPSAVIENHVRTIRYDYLRGLRRFVRLSDINMFI